MTRLTINLIVYVTLFTNIKLTTSAKNRFLKKPCTLHSICTQYKDKKVDHKWECELDPDDADGIGGLTFEVNGLKIDERTVVSGHTLLNAPGSEISKNSINVHNARTISTIQKKIPQGQATTPVAVVGKKSVLVVRIEANDAATTTNMTTLSDKVYGTYGDPFNLRSGYQDCSYNKLDFYPGVNENIDQNGVTTIQIDMNVVGVSRHTVKNAAVASLNIVLGGIPETYFNHIMFCLPPGTTQSSKGGKGWVAYAGINTWYSVFNDHFCNYPSIQMHEIGHNIGLDHSGEKDEPYANYADSTGMMGSSYRSDDWPRMCFNGAKSWQLGWYQEQMHTVEKPWVWKGNIVGIDDYTGTSDDPPVIIRLVGVSKQYFVSFNRMKGINRDTREGEDQIMITQHDLNKKKSWLEAKLNKGDKYTFTDVDNNPNILLKVLKVNLNDNYARIQISPGPPTSCPEGRFLLNVTFFTDKKSKKDNQWTISKYKKSGELKRLKRSPKFKIKDKRYDHSICLIENGCYIFHVTDKSGDGICCEKGDGYYELLRDGDLMVRSQFENGSEETYDFGNDCIR